MEDNRNEQKNSSVNVIAVILAFLIGLTVGNVDMNKLRSAVNSATASQTLISREQTEAESTEKLNQTEKAAEKTQPETTEATAKFQSEQEASVNTDSFTVYITPTGKRYHFDPYCAGRAHTEVDLDEAKERGLTPCKRCVGAE